MLIPFDDLFRRYHIKVDGVLHLGANTGQEAADYAKQKIPKVIWVEAVPRICAKLRHSIAAYPGQIALEACISNVNDAPVRFNIASNSGMSSSFLELGTHATEHPTVTYISTLELKTVRVDTLLARHNLTMEGDWFLNIDLQGAEMLALEGMGRLLERVRYAYIEVNERELYIGCPHVSQIDVYLARFGLIGMETKMTGSGWGDKFYLKK